ncbi:MAG TPA: hypothetical protein VGJ81_22120 [Thermoanaerobaculia bacterium]|jgi:hypothetical protein
MDIIPFLRNEWRNLSAAPFSFITLATASSALAYSVARWRYEGLLSILRERIQSRDDRIDAKDEQLDEYRQKLDLSAPGRGPSGAALSRQSDELLQQRTLVLVRDLREFIARREQEDRASTEREFRTRASTQADTIESDAFADRTRALLARSRSRTQEYDERFKVEAILLRDELRARLPNRMATNGMLDSSFEHPVNFFCYREVADELEKMARLLV